jgi:hypothetical protein
LAATNAQNPASGGETNLAAFRASLRSEEVIGSEAVKRAYVTLGTNEFAFVVPKGYRMDASIPEKITLIKDDYACSISLHFASAKSNGAAQPQADTVRQTVLERYPSTKIRDEFSQTAAGSRGPAFDLQFPNAAGALQFARVVFIPYANGVIEFTLLSNPDQFAIGQYAFDTLLLTFSSNQDGKLSITPLSDKS